MVTAGSSHPVAATGYPSWLRLPDDGIGWVAVAVLHMVTAKSSHPVEATGKAPWLKKIKNKGIGF